METFLQTIGALNDETRLKLLRFIDIHGAVCVCIGERVEHAR